MKKNARYALLGLGSFLALLFVFVAVDMSNLRGDVVDLGATDQEGVVAERQGQGQELNAIDMDMEANENSTMCTTSEDLKEKFAWIFNEVAAKRSEAAPVVSPAQRQAIITSRENDLRNLCFVRESKGVVLVFDGAFYIGRVSVIITARGGYELGETVITQRLAASAYRLLQKHYPDFFFTL